MMDFGKNSNKTYENLDKCHAISNDENVRREKGENQTFFYQF